MTNLEFGDKNRTILFRKKDDSIVQIKPTKWKNIDDVTKMLENILSQYTIADGFLGTVFKPTNRTTWDSITSLLDYHELIGNEKLKIEDLEHLDIDDLRRLFVTETETTSHEGRSVPNNKVILPSMLAVINSLDFFEILRVAIEAREKNQAESLTEQTK